jgi:hypothetical protein
MRWDDKEKNNGWKVRFAFLPIKTGDTWIWLELFIRKPMSDHSLVDFWSGCAERVGYPCDCFRH